MVAVVLPDPVPTVWIDASVELEIDTQGDLYRELDRVENCSLLGSNARIEYRRLRAQGSWWMAMALCKGRVTTVVSAHENLNAMLEHMAPPNTDRGVWAAAVAWVLEPHGVFDGWTRRADLDGEKLSDRAMDRLMVEKARDHQLTLVTRDAGVIKKKGPKQGVTPIEPEDYARAIISRETGRTMFLERLERAALAWLASEPLSAQRVDAMGVLLRQFRWIWEPADATPPLASSSGLGAQLPGERMFARVLGCESSR